MRTPFYDCHVKYGGKIVEFCGYELPIQFEGIIKEHNRVRENAGLFDVSHMGEFFLEGKGAIEFADKIVPNRVSELVDGQALYTPLCREDGTTVDDLLVYRMDAENVLLVVNAANIDKDFAHISSIDRPESVKLTNRSKDFAQLAIQGPKAPYIVQKLIEEGRNVDNIGFFHFERCLFAGVQAIVSRTGYTGEYGFEIYFDSLDKAHDVWESIMEAGKEYYVQPIGLGARDTLRFEGCLMLYGNDLNDTTTPLDAKLNWTIDWNSDFIGKAALLKQKEEGYSRRLAGLEIIDKGIARHDYEVYSLDEKKIGVITSGTKCPTLNKIMAMAYIESPLWKKGNEVLVKVRNKFIKAKTVKMPFYKKPALTMVNKEREA
ncbi:MAG: glycine cleavage system protein T [Candidatus Muiribacterium halophilum]|uniref:Aminomethyltransferase n=1 Tax=Muiribacterium halophilum TaxID=2053465 RepID=A0A2N5ZEA6_MUIH1|nr:MAG: glycine cleavage system protein T [Candidatus Muirbacterium halophilum]